MVRELELEQDLGGKGGERKNVSGKGNIMFRKTWRLEGTLCLCEVEIRPACWDIESKDLGWPKIRPER